MQTSYTLWKSVHIRRNKLEVMVFSYYPILLNEFVEHFRKYIIFKTMFSMHIIMANPGILVKK